MSGAAALACAQAIRDGGESSRLCAMIAALALLALAAQQSPEAPGRDGGWRVTLGAGAIDARGWALRLPLPPSPAATDDAPLPMHAMWEEPRAALPGAIADPSGYALDAVREGVAPVPRMLLERLPPSLAGLEPGEARKRLFISAMLPALLAENERLLERRARLRHLIAAERAGEALTDSERGWLAALAETYGVAPWDGEGLLHRVDAIPPSLALAQAALESGWGASRGAQQAHSMFGHIAIAADAERGVLRRFESMPEAIAAYAHNLNTHRAYAGLRDARARQRSQDVAVDGHALAGALSRYSERGESYVRDVRALIRANRLDGFDRARLGS